MSVDSRPGLRYHSRSTHRKYAAHEHSARRNGASPEEDGRGRDVRILGDLFRAYRARLCEFARVYVECPASAEEIVHDVFLRMWEQRSILRECAKPRRYLYAAVRNQALKHLAHEAVVRRSHEMVKRTGRVPGTGEAPAPVDDELHARELSAAFEDAVDRLPPRCREAFTLCRREGRSYAEAAAVMGTSERTVETQLARAKKVLRRELAEWVR